MPENTERLWQAKVLIGKQGEKCLQPTAGEAFEWHRWRAVSIKNKQHHRELFNIITSEVKMMEACDAQLNDACFSAYCNKYMCSISVKNITN